MKFKFTICLTIASGLLVSWMLVGQYRPAAIFAQEPLRTAEPINQVVKLPEPGKVSQARLEAVINQGRLQATQQVKDLAHLRKMDSHLQTLLAAQLQQKEITDPAIQNEMQITGEGSVLVDIYVTDLLTNVTSALTNERMEIEATDAHFNIVEGWIPVSSLLSVAQLEFVQAIIPVIGFGTDTGSVLSEGDGAHNGPAARLIGANGQGVIVGVISDSADEVSPGLAGSQSLGDLPAITTIFQEDLGGDDEGRAMAEIIYDIAPGIPAFYFATGYFGPVNKANNIDRLVAAGVDIIADDTSYLYEPFFEDGVVAQAVDRAYNANVPYFASAGNRARRSYESYYRNSGSSGLHDFNPEAGIDTLQTINNVYPGGHMRIYFQWDDPWGNATHDFDIFLYNVTNPTTPLDYSTGDNIVSGIPFEYLSWTNYTSNVVTVGIVVSRHTGSGSSFFKYISGDNSITEYDTASDAINPGAASAKGSIAVAAVSWNEPGLDDPDDYSSRGPKIRLFDMNGNRFSSPEIRQKPNVAGATCVSTSPTYEAGQGFSYNTFCGTSAAAPHIAGIAALMKSSRPDLPASFIYTILTDPNNTIDCTLGGNPDNDCGFGFVLADNAVARAQSIPILKVYLPIIAK